MGGKQAKDPSRSAPCVGMTDTQVQALIHRPRLAISSSPVAWEIMAWHAVSEQTYRAWIDHLSSSADPAADHSEQAARQVVEARNNAPGAGVGSTMLIRLPPKDLTR